MKNTAALILSFAIFASAGAAETPPRAVVVPEPLATSAGARGAAADPAEDVRKAEMAFARAFADRDQARFAALILDDATFLPARRTLSGKAAIMEVWSKYLEPKQPPFSWRPERVAVNGSGTIGLSTGPVFDPDGKQIGIYSSIWIKQSDGSWKIEFDGPGCPPPCPPAAPSGEKKP